MKNEIYSPREDSYFLAQVLEDQIVNLNLTVLEIGSGSGIQLETLFELGVKKQNIYSCDINIDAVENCENLGFNCIQSDLFENINEKFDFIIFNPPYLPEDSLELESSKIITTGGKKGNEIINEFLKQAENHLNENGKILLVTSSLTEDPNFLDYKKKIIARKKMFFEELIIWELRL